MSTPNIHDPTQFPPLPASRAPTSAQGTAPASSSAPILPASSTSSTSPYPPRRPQSPHRPQSPRSQPTLQSPSQLPVPGVPAPVSSSPHAPTTGPPSPPFRSSVSRPSGTRIPRIGSTRITKGSQSSSSTATAVLAYSLSDMQMPPYWTRLAWAMKKDELETHRKDLRPGHIITLQSRLFRMAISSPLKQKRRLRKAQPQPNPPTCTLPSSTSSGTVSSELDQTSTGSGNQRSEVNDVVFDIDGVGNSPAKETSRETLDDYDFSELAGSENVQSNVDPSLRAQKIRSFVANDPLRLRPLRPDFHLPCKSIWLYSKHCNMEVPEEVDEVLVRPPTNGYEKAAFEKTPFGTVIKVHPMSSGPYQFCLRKSNGTTEEIVRHHYSPHPPMALKFGNLVDLGSSGDQRRFETWIHLGGEEFGRLSVELHGNALGYWEADVTKNGQVHLILLCPEGQFLLQMRWNGVIRDSRIFNTSYGSSEGSNKEDCQALIFIQNHNLLDATASIKIYGEFGFAIEEDYIEHLDERSLGVEVGSLSMIEYVDEFGIPVHGETYYFPDFGLFFDSLSPISIVVPESDEIKKALLNYRMLTSSNACSDEKTKDFKKWLKETFEFPAELIVECSFAKMNKTYHRVEMTLNMDEMEYDAVMRNIESEVYVYNCLDRGEKRGEYTMFCDADQMDVSIILLALSDEAEGVLRQMEIVNGKAILASGERMHFEQLNELYPEDVEAARKKLSRRLRDRCQFLLKLPSESLSLHTISSEAQVPG